MLGGGGDYANVCGNWMNTDLEKTDGRNRARNAPQCSPRDIAMCPQPARPPHISCRLTLKDIETRVHPGYVTCVNPRSESTYSLMWFMNLINSMFFLLD